MSLRGIIIVIYLKIVCIDNRMIPLNYLPIQPVLDDTVTEEAIPEDSMKVMSLKEANDDKEGFGFVESEIKIGDTRTQKPCSVVVLSNAQNPNMQSLLRKYRYDANGFLIPSSVKYFIKMPQGHGSESVLVPLNDKAFSPLGGFVRYYKEVPPIPQSW